MNYEDLFTILIIILIICFILYYSYRFLTNVCNGDESLEYFIYENSDSSIKKTIMIVAGTHGNEPAGHYALKDLISDLNLGIKKINPGIRLILIPSVNYCALKVNLRYIPFIGDLNRKYPKTECQKITSKINRKVVELLQDTDFILDFHEGWGFNKQNSKSIGSTFTPTNTELSNDLAYILVIDINNTIQTDYKKFRIITNDETLIQNDPEIYVKNEDTKGTLRYYANIINKDYILVETTGQNNIQHIDIRIEQCKNIINNVFEYFDI